MGYFFHKSFLLTQEGWAELFLKFAFPARVPAGPKKWGGGEGGRCLKQTSHAAERTGKFIAQRQQ